jgi:hypothetical protein
MATNCVIYKLPHNAIVERDNVAIKNITLESQRDALERALRDPRALEGGILRYTLMEILRRYTGMYDATTQSVYLHYLMGRDFEESAHILNISEGRAHRCFNTFIAKFHRFTVDLLKKGNVDIEETHCYVECIKDKKMDDNEVSSAFDEEILVTKVMRHFLRHANLTTQFILSTLVADTLGLITYIDFIHFIR